MRCFLQQYGGAFVVVNWNSEKLRIQRYDFKRKIRGGVGVAVPIVAVPPIVRAAKDRQALQDESLAIETVLLKDSDRFLHRFALVRLKTVRTNQQRQVKDQQGDQSSSNDPGQSLEQAALLRTICFRGFRIRPQFCRIVDGQWTSAAPARLVRACVD